MNKLYGCLLDLAKTASKYNYANHSIAKKAALFFYSAIKIIKDVPRIEMLFQ